jgi:hypothetical protein
LTVTKNGTGSGTVTSVPPGIDCGAICSDTYAGPTTLVTLTATPDPTPDHRFLGWGGTCSGTSTCEVAVEGDVTVTATFGYCAASYPTVCIPPSPPDLNCEDITFRNFTVLYNVPNPDPHGLDSDQNGVGCET